MLTATKLNNTLPPMKKYLSLLEAMDLIGECSAVIVENDLLAYPVLYEMTGEDDNIWLFISGDSIDCRYSYKFIEADTPIKFDGQSLWMQDDEGDEVKLTLLYPRSITE